jgi:hypothetical protein
MRKIICIKTSNYHNSVSYQSLFVRSIIKSGLLDFLLSAIHLQVMIRKGLRL